MVQRRDRQSASLKVWVGNTRIFPLAAQEAKLRHYVGTNTVIEKEHFHIV